MDNTHRGAAVEAVYAETLRLLARPVEPVLVGQVAAFGLDEVEVADVVQLDLFAD